MRRALPALCVLAAGVGLTGCGGGDCGSDKGSGEPPASSLEAPERPRFGSSSSGSDSPGCPGGSCPLGGRAGAGVGASGSYENIGGLARMPGKLFDGSREGSGDASPAVLTAGFPSGLGRSRDTVPDGVRGGGLLLATFQRRASDPTPVPVYESGRGGPLVFESGMTICTDGRIADPDRRGEIQRQDPDHQRGTALRYAGGRAVDPTRVPYVVLPAGFGAAEVGDLALVEYGGRRVYAVVGDRGPAMAIGEGSVALAQALGIDSHGGKGGVRDGVRYTVFPRSGTTSPAGEAELLDFIATRGRAVAARVPSSIGA